MDQYNDRRYRLNGDEELTMELVRARLLEIVDSREDLIEAKILFRVLYRFETYRVGRPVYPEPATWDTIASWLKDNGPFNDEGLHRLKEDPEKSP